MKDHQEVDANLSQIIKQIQSGDRRSYALLIDRFQRQIFLYCYYLLRNQEEAEDAAQDIFIKGLEHIHQFTFSASFSAWLYKIAKHHCSDRVKKKTKENKGLIRYQWEQQQENEITYTEYIHECLDQLTAEEKQIVLLRSLENYSYEEISFIMDIRASTLRKKYERIRKKLMLKKIQGGEIHGPSIRVGR